MKKLFVLILAVTIASGCNKYGNVRLQYPAMPLMSMPANIHTIAVINRTMPPPNNIQPSTLKKIGNVIMSYMVGNEKLASDDALKGVYDRIKGWRNLNVVIPTHTRYYGTGTRQTPELMDWGVVKQICDSNRAEVLLVMETFSYSTNLLANEINNSVNALLTGNIPQPQVQQLHVNVQCFWRLYDPFQRRIIDEFETSNYMDVPNAGGVVPVAPPDALQRVAYNAGVQYIQRFLPIYHYVTRTMYKRGKGYERQQFLAAFRRAEVADWQGAIPIWQQLAQSRKRINAGRACLDIAVSYEVLGDINAAMQWATKGYEDYRNKICRNYRSDLAYRLRIEY